MEPTSWLHVLATEIEMAPGFLAALDQQLRSHARSLVGADDIANGGYTLLPPDDGFSVQFRSTDTGVVGVIEGELVDPSAFAHPVTLGWRARGAPGLPSHPNQERDDLEFFWMAFPIGALSAGTRADTAAAAATVTAPFPVDWDVHNWEGGVWLGLHTHRPFDVAELDALNLAVQRAVRDWNAHDPNGIDYIARPEIAPDHVSIRWYLDVGVAGADVLVDVINALGVVPAASAVVRCSVGRRC
jgi:hypothetical protein